LLLPGEPGYTIATQPANTRFEAVRPMAAAQCAGERDVATCVRWSIEHGVQPVARTGGHSYAGYSTTRGLVIDLAALAEVKVDTAAGTATIGGGATNAKVFEATHCGELILPDGTCPSVGVGGLTLGGGIGYNTHWAGLTCDRLRASRIVTAAGEVLELDESNHSDLLWACRGGAGGSFGINTRFTFELAPIPQPEVAFYRFDYVGAEAAEAILPAFDEMLRTAPVELNAVAMSQATPVARGAGPRDAIATFSRGQYLGPMEELLEIVEPLRRVAKPSSEVLETLPFWKVQKMLTTKEGALHSFGDVSRYSRAPLTAEVVAKVVDLLAECPSRDEANNGSVWSLGWVGGATVDSIGRRDTAYVHRGALTLLRATPVWETSADPTVGNDLVRWSKAVIKTIAPYTTRESYQNFPNRGIEDWQRAYYAENFERLVEIKTKYDRHDVFHNAQSIPPHRRASRRT
jgi:FAD/FMN-containing dehydrogenase